MNKSNDLEPNDYFEKLSKDLSKTLTNGKHNVVICESVNKNGFWKKRIYVNGELIPNSNVVFIKENEPTITLADKVDPKVVKSVGTAQEVPVQEQLSEKDLYCIAKHLQIFVKKYYHDQDVSDSTICEKCSHIKECTQNYSRVIDPYPSLKKIANMAEVKISEFRTNL